MSQDPRARLIKLLHVGRRELGMAEESYRAILTQASGGRASSAKDLRLAELEAALDHMKRCGFAVKGDTGKSGSYPRTNQPQLDKLRALWLALHQAGEVRDASETALARFCQRHTGVEALAWLTVPQVSRLIEHLKKWQQRTQAGARAA